MQHISGAYCGGLGREGSELLITVLRFILTIGRTTDVSFKGNAAPKNLPASEACWQVSSSAVRDKGGW
jgi:hypothetical protein